MNNRPDNELINHALNMWANWIETGDVIISMQDAINCGEKEKIQPLTHEQQKFVVRLRELAADQIF